MAMVQGKPKEQQKPKNNFSVFMQRIGKSTFKPNEPETVQSAPHAQTFHQQFSTFWQKNVSNNKKQDYQFNQSPTPVRHQLPRRNTIATKEDRQLVQAKSAQTYQVGKGGTVRQESYQCQTKSFVSKSTMPKVKHESMECLSSIDENRGYKPSDTKDPKTAEFLSQLYKNIFMNNKKMNMNNNKKTVSKNWESSNYHQESSTESTLLDKIMTPAPQEQHSESLKRRDPGKMFTDSSFYSAEHHPTVAQQLEMAHRLSSALFNEDKKSSKGRQMYLKRLKLTGETIDEDVPAPRHDKVPNLKLVMNPHGKVQEWSDVATEDAPKMSAVVTKSIAPTPSPNIETEAMKNESSISRPSTFLSAYKDIFDQNRGVFGNARQIEPTPPLRHKLIQHKSVTSPTPSLQAEKQNKINQPAVKIPNTQVKLPTTEVDKVDIVLKTPALLPKEPSRLEEKQNVKSIEPPRPKEPSRIEQKEQLRPNEPPRPKEPPRIGQKEQGRPKEPPRPKEPSRIEQKEQLRPNEPPRPKEPSRIEQKEQVITKEPPRPQELSRIEQKEHVMPKEPSKLEQKEQVRSITPTTRDTDKQFSNIKPILKSQSPQITISSKEADKIDVVLKTPALLPTEISKFEPMGYKNTQKFPQINSTSAVANTRALFEYIDEDRSKHFNPIKKSKTFSSFPVDNRRETLELTPTVPVRDSSKKYLAPYKSMNSNMNNINNLNECSFEKSRNSNLNNVNRINDNAITKSLNSNLNNIYNYNNSSCTNSPSSARRIPLQNFFI